jgi:hypothetical protein
MLKNSMFLVMSWTRQVPCREVPNGVYDIKITIPERIGNIYTMAERETDQGKDENVMAYFKNMYRSSISAVVII